jgi:GT2 family glycosyltransferase
MPKRKSEPRVSSDRATPRTGNGAAKAGSSNNVAAGERSTVRRKRPRAASEVDDLRSVVDQQRRDLDELSDRVDSLLERQEWIQSGLYDLNLSLTALGQRDDGSADGRIAYLESVRAVREVVRRKLPPDASVIVASKGDELLDLYGRRAKHFPQGPEGGYAGFYPTDGTAVIAHLETLRARGAQYLIFPKLALWWLESYPRFIRHLHRHYATVESDPNKCVIFALERHTALDRTVWRPRLLDLVGDYSSHAGIEPTVLDWNTDLGLKELLPSHAVFVPPTDETSLPYLDASIDIVVVLSPDKKTLAEAHRVAGYAVVVLEPLDPSPRAIGDAAERLEVSIEHVNGELKRTAPSTSIIIPTFNGLDHLDRCLASLDETLPHPFEGEVIVVDDASGEETQELLGDWRQSAPRLNLKILRNKSNVGFVKSCNRGAAEASGDVLVFLNDDTLPQFGWLPALVRLFRTHPNAGAVGGKLLYPEGRLQEAGSVIYSDGSGANFGRGDYLADDPLFSFVREVDYCSAALLATPREVFTEIGGFDERYSPAYYEDADYCFALRDRGYAVYYQPESVIVHIEGATGGRDLSAGTKKHQVANREKFAAKWAKALREQPEPRATYDLETWYRLAQREARP